MADADGSAQSRQESKSEVLASTHLITCTPVDRAGCFPGGAQTAQMKDLGTTSLNPGSAAQKQALSPSWSEALLLSHSDSDIALRLLQCCENNPDKSISSSVVKCFEESWHNQQLFYLTEHSQRIYLGLLAESWK